jgi:ribonuclease P protein component
MVPKKSRIPRTEFGLQGYRSARSPFFSLKVRKNNSGEAGMRNRVAVVVGKSVDKRAVRRNSLKRQVKSQLLKLPANGIDLVITIYPKANELTKQHFMAEMKKIIQQFV